MIAVDSSVWIDFLNGNETREVAQLLRLLGTEPLLIGDVVLLEVLQGIRAETDAIRVEEALRRFDVEPMLDPQLAILAASHFRRLRGFGITVRKTVDLIIGTFCIARGHALLTTDKDFAPMARHLGLSLI